MNTELTIEINQEAISQLSLSDLLSLRRDYQRDIDECQFAEDEKGVDIAIICQNVLTLEINSRKNNLFIY